MMLLRALVMGVIIGGVAANAAAIQANEAADSLAAADAATLLQFYPAPLATSPVGAIEDKAVWLAKVQGLIEDAPPLLQQSMLASKTQKQFAANLALLEQMQQGTLQKGVTAAKSVAKSGKLVAKDSDGKAGPNLGSGPADTVYTTLEPCRILDSRNATVASGVHGPLVGNQLYHLPGYVGIGSNWGQFGGNATSDCGLNGAAGPNIWAVAIVITILNPNFDAFLGVGDVATLASTLSTVALNYTHGQGLSTLYIVPQTVSGNIIYFAMPAQLSANIIFDVVGYFAVSQATALECTYPYSVGSGTVANGDNFSLSAPSCDAGYTITGVACDTGALRSLTPLTNVGTFGLTFLSYCNWVNSSGITVNAANFAAVAACCRVPGR